MPTVFLPLATALLALLASFQTPGGGDDLVADFQRFYSKKRPREDRKAMVLDLKGVDSLAAAQALLVAFEDDDYHVRRAAIEVVAAMRAEATARWLTDEVLLDRKQAKRKRLRAGLAEAVGGMGHALVLDPLLDLLQQRDLGLRLAAAAGLGRLGDRRACRPLAGLAGDADGALAMAALDALANIGWAGGAREAALGALVHPAKRVRLKAIEVVVHLRLKEGVRPLIMAMQDDADARVQEDAYEALKVLTMRDFSDQAVEWLAWWDRNESRFELPDPVAIEKARRELAKTGTRYAAAKAFATIETKSENILFVIDVSESMDTPFGDPARLAASGRRYASLRRLGIVKEELVHTIEELSADTAFNIITFATGVSHWKKRLVKANTLNRKNAVAWVGKLKPLGKRGLATFRSRMGMQDISSSEGQTNTFLALMTALGVPSDGEATKVDVVSASKSPVDTIYFLTDGEPTVGTTVDMGEIRAEVRRVNSYRGVQIHVIYVGNYGGHDLRQLAEENQGVFVSIGG